VRYKLSRFEIIFPTRDFAFQHGGNAFTGLAGYADFKNR